MNVTWNGRFDLSESDILRLVLKKPGIYILWVRLQDKSWKAFYVGQADNLEKRLLAHVSDSEPNQCIRGHVKAHICSMHFAVVDHQQDRDGVEKYLFDSYSPECNMKDPGGRPVPVNLPQ